MSMKWTYLQNRRNNRFKMRWSTLCHFYSLSKNARTTNLFLLYYYYHVC